WRSMAITPSEGKQVKGGERHGCRERATEQGCVFCPVPLELRDKLKVFSMRRLSAKIFMHPTFRFYEFFRGNYLIKHMKGIGRK
ncbi:MAG: hypothetical protein PHE26_12195, partial [Syntrophomonadaceae bacterium]|nr:hypothetical protein [Syntrophomonadaceae bacterium]